MKKFLLVLTVIMAGFMTEENEIEAQDLPFDKEDLIYMDLEFGRVIIHLRPDVAPNHVERVKELAREGFYDGIAFHRVIPGFMAQGGDPTGTGAGGSDKGLLKAEFNAVPHLRGTLSMARTDDPDSADSQFFICFVRCAQLDNKYTVWGRIVRGMEFVDQIAPGEPPRQPSKIVKMRVASDVKE